MDAVESVPSNQGTSAMKLTSATPTKGCTVTTQQTGLGSRPECVHVSDSGPPEPLSLDMLFLQLLIWNNQLSWAKYEVGLVFMHQWAGLVTLGRHHVKRADVDTFRLFFWH